MFWPAITDCDEGEIVRLKSAAELTTSVTEAVCVLTPSLAEIVNGYVPTGVLSEVVMLKVDVPDPVRLAGLNVPSALAGSPATLNVTVPAYPAAVVRETE
jgi:hypothetical protein